MHIHYNRESNRQSNRHFDREILTKKLAQNLPWVGEICPKIFRKWVLSKGDDTMTMRVEMFGQCLMRYKLPSQARLDILEVAEKAKDLGWSATLDPKRKKREVIIENKAKKARIVKTWLPGLHDDNTCKFDTISNVSPEDHVLEYFRSAWDTGPKVVVWELYPNGWGVKGIKNGEWVCRKYPNRKKREAIELFVDEIKPKRWNE